MNQSTLPPNLRKIPTGVWTALATPFDEKGRLDWEAFDGLLARQLAARVTGVVVVGSTGEATSLTVQEKLSLIRRAYAKVGNQLCIMAGTGLSNTDQTVELSKLAVEAGADSLLVVTPPYNRPNIDGLVAHYEAIGREVPAPICIYHVPHRTGRRLSVAEFSRLAELPFVRMIKDSSADIALFSRARLACSVPFVSGDDTTYLASRAVGGVGWVSVGSNVFPEACMEMDRAFGAGDTQKALQLHEILSPFFQLLECDSNPIPLKGALSVVGMCRNEVRLPLSALSPEWMEKMGETVHHTQEKLREIQVGPLL